MKPKIIAYRTSLGELKWRCFSQEYSDNGQYVREGHGYTPRVAYLKWRGVYRVFYP